MKKRLILALIILGSAAVLAPTGGYSTATADYARQNAAFAQGFLQGLVHTPDLGLARQEHQQAARLVGQRLLHRLHHARLDPLTGRLRRAPANIHREQAAFTAQHRRIAE